MSHDLTETDEFTATVTVPDGVDSRDHAAEDVEAIAQALANRTKNLGAHRAKVDEPNTFTGNQTFADDVTVNGTTRIPNVNGDVRVNAGSVDADNNVRARIDVVADGRFAYMAAKSRVVTINPCSCIVTSAIPLNEGQLLQLPPGVDAVWPIIVPHAAVMNTVVVKLASETSGTTATLKLYRHYGIDMAGGLPPYGLIDSAFPTIPDANAYNEGTLTFDGLVASSFEAYTLYIKNTGATKNLYVRGIQFLYDETLLTTHGSR